MLACGLGIDVSVLQCVNGVGMDLVEVVCSSILVLIIVTSISIVLSCCSRRISNGHASCRLSIVGCFGLRFNISVMSR